MNKERFYIFRSARLVFKEAEKPPVISEEDRKKAQEIGKESVGQARNKAKSSAIEKGKSEALAAAGGKAPVTPEKLTVPEIPNKLSGLKVDSKEAKIDKSKGTIEQPFKFGDLNIKGKIIMPEKAEPGAKTTYLFNYVDDPDKFDHGKFIDELKKRKTELGNTVVITLRTPEGETKINREKVNTMEKLVGDLERFQADLSKDPRYAGLTLPRTEKILHMTSTGEAEKVKSLLNKYAEASAKKDSRVLQVRAIIDNNPDNFIASLERAISPVAANPEAPIGPENPAPQPGAGGAKGHGGGGMPSGAGGGMPSGSGGGMPSGTGTDQPPASSDGQSAGPVETNSSPSESKEAVPGTLDKLLVLGDSLMVGGERGLRANDFLKTQSSKPLDIVKEAQDTSKDLDQRAVGGWACNQILSLIQKMEKSGRMERYRNQTLVMDGGVNDLAGGQTPDQIIGNMQKIWAIARKFNMRVFCCTLTPFKGASGWKDSLKIDYEKKEGYRNEINERLAKLAGTSEGPDKLIELHKPYSQGGLADDNDPSALHPAYAAGDKLHLTGAGNAQMTKAIQEVIGLPGAPTADAAKVPSAGGKTSLTPAEIQASQPSNGKVKVTVEDRKAADAYLAEVNSRPNPSAAIGETKLLPGGEKLLKVAWHANHKGQWGTPGMQILPGYHVGVQVEAVPDAQKKSQKS